MSESNSRNKHGRLVSDRGIELIEQRVLDVPLVTVENYEKWYNIFIIQPSGEVEKVTTSLIDDLNRKSNIQLWIDHEYHPKLLQLIAEHVGGEVPSTTLEIVAGRWVLSRESDPDISY